MRPLGLHTIDVPPDNELLRGLNKEEIGLILAAARSQRLSAKSVIMYQSQPADRLWLLWQGRARYFYETIDGKKLVLLWITPGHVFGAAAFAVHPSTYLVSTEATQDSTVLVWDARTIRDLGLRFPRLMMNAYLTAMSYLSWYVATHAALASESARERLAHIIVGYAPSIGQRVSEGIELDVTNEELADAANITLYTASRLISEWHRIGAIGKRRGKILLRSARGLFLPPAHKPLRVRRPDKFSAHPAN